MNHSRNIWLAIAVTLLWLSTTAQGSEPGWLGLAFQVDATGVLNPVVRSITVEKVFAGSPAARAGLAVGDSILEVQGVVVAGAKADVLSQTLKMKVGDTVRLKIRRGAEDIRQLSIVAVQKPPAP